MEDFILQHYPFITVTAVLWLVGHFMERSVFTRARALETVHKNKFWAGFWYWGRESMELHPVLAGAVIGLLWHNPENYGAEHWSWQLDLAYFAGAGVTSLFGWLILTKALARFGIDTHSLTLPGESMRPPALPRPPKTPTDVE